MIELTEDNMPAEFVGKSYRSGNLLIGICHFFKYKDTETEACVIAEYDMRSEGNRVKLTDYVYRELGAAENGLDEYVERLGLSDAVVIAPFEKGKWSYKGDPHANGGDVKSDTGITIAFSALSNAAKLIVAAPEMYYMLHNIAYKARLEGAFTKEDISQLVSEIDVIMKRIGDTEAANE